MTNLKYLDISEGEHLVMHIMISVNFRVTVGK